MKDLLIAKDVTFDDKEENTSFNVVNFESEEPKSSCAVVVPRILNFEDTTEKFIIPESVVDFKMPQLVEDAGDSQAVIIVPETCPCNTQGDSDEPIIEISDICPEQCSKENIIPENVIFNGIENLPIETLIQHIKSESRDYFRGTSFR